MMYTWGMCCTIPISYKFKLTEILVFSGVVAERDIVQFVPYLEFTARRQGDTMMSVKARLAKEVLAEIPEQFISYMKARGRFVNFLSFVRYDYVIVFPCSNKRLWF